MAIVRRSAPLPGSIRIQLEYGFSHRQWLTRRSWNAAALLENLRRYATLAERVAQNFCPAWTGNQTSSANPSSTKVPQSPSTQVVPQSGSVESRGHQYGQILETLRSMRAEMGRHHSRTSGQNEPVGNRHVAFDLAQLVNAHSGAADSSLQAAETEIPTGLGQSQGNAGPVSVREARIVARPIVLSPASFMRSAIGRTGRMPCMSATGPAVDHSPEVEIRPVPDSRCRDRTAWSGGRPARSCSAAISPDTFRRDAWRTLGAPGRWAMTSPSR